MAESFASRLEENGFNVNFRHIAVEDEFIKQASVDSQFEKYKLDTNGVLEVIRNEQENKA